MTKPLQLDGPGLPTTSSLPLYDPANIICLVMDCGDPLRAYKVVPIDDTEVTLTIVVDIFTGTWKFKVDPSRVPSQFWITEQRFEIKDRKLAFALTDLNKIPKHESPPLEEHAIFIGKAVVDRSLHDILSSLTVDNGGGIYHVVGVFDKTNLEHLTEMANAIVIDCD